LLPYSIPGTIREKEVAASMTPAAAPNIVLTSRGGICLKNKMGNAPTPVANPASRLAKTPRASVSIDSSPRPSFMFLI
jgi:hypothetical protein